MITVWELILVKSLEQMRHIICNIVHGAHAFHIVFRIAGLQAESKVPVRASHHVKVVDCEKGDTGCR